MASQPASSAPAPAIRGDIADTDAPRRAVRGGSRRSRWLARLLAGGTRGNEQLTTLTGAVLVVLLAALGVTIVRIRPLLGPHMFIGLLLIGPVLLKMASTGYRFARYYAHDRAYVKKGAPPANLRLLAPFVVISTVVVFATGVALLVVGPSSRSSLLPIHKISFFAWLALAGLHLLGHLPDLAHGLRLKDGPGAALAAGDPAGEQLVRYSAGNSGRMLSLGGAIVAGTVLAVLYIPQFTPWLNTHHFGH
jgi:uncharacterized membrane protein (DUF441 family)